MKNKNLIIILSHCDTKEKRKVLTDNIKILKDKGFDILLTSHIPVPLSIQNQVEYVVYDKSNPIIQWPHRGMVFWKKLLSKTKSYRLQNIVGDYGFTAFNQMLIGGNLGVSLNYSHYSFINYDIEITDPIIKSLNSPIGFLTSKVKDDREKVGYRYPSFMFNILSKDNVIKFLSLVDMPFYMSDNHSHLKVGRFEDAESYLEELIRPFFHSVFQDLVVDKIRFDDLSSLFNFSKDPNFKLFFQNNNTHKKILSDSWVPKVIIYDNKLTNLELIVDDLTFTVSNQNYTVIDLPKNIKKIGYRFNKKFTNLTEKYNSSNYSTINDIK